MKNIKTFLLTFFWFCSAMQVQGQWTNQIPNYSFEAIDFSGWWNSGLLHVGNPYDQYYDCPSCSFSSLNSEDKIIQYWSYMDDWTVPEKKFFCVPGQTDAIPTPDITYAPSWTGSAFPRSHSGQFWPYTGSGEGEFVIVQPDPVIENNKIYYIEAFVNKYGYPNPYGSIDLFEDKPKACGYNQYLTEYSTNSDYQTILEVQYPGFSPDINGWTRFRSFFIATEDRNWLSIGSPDGMHWDDIRIYEVDNTLCRDEWYFDNTVFNYPIEVFQASNFIKVGEGVDPEQSHLDGPVVIKANSSVILRAGNFIEIGPDLINTGGTYVGTGIDMEPGSELEIYIEPCKDLCPPIQAPDTYFECIGVPTQIGIPTYVGTYAQMTWSPSIYLNDPNSPNPTFTPPPGSGNIVYTVTYKQECEVPNYTANGTYNVTVLYSDGLAPPPSVSYSNLTFDDFNLSTNINVNNSVQELVIDWTPSQNSPGSLTFYRASSFPNNTMLFELGHLFASCCSDVTFTVTAIDYCGNETQSTFIWTKDQASAIPTIPAITYWFSPGNPGDSNGTIFDGDFCFTSHGACYYTMEIVNQWGQTKYDESNFITSEETCTDFIGETNLGLTLSDGFYWVKFTLTNDCGNELTTTYAPFNLYNPNKSAQFAENDDYEENTESAKIDVSISTIKPGEITFVSSSVGTKVYQVYNASGKLITEGTFTQSESVSVASGLYFISVINDQGVTLSDKIFVSND